MKLTIIIIAALVVCVAAAVIYGAAHWKRRTRELRAKLEGARLPIQPTTYDPRETDALPLPVQRYFRTVLTDGRPMIAAARLSHKGQFNTGESKGKRHRFKSTQVVTTRRPGFVWDARISMAPGVKAFVHDAYVAGEGSLHAEVLGLITVADVRGTPEIAQGELLRYLAEAAWYPTALLPSQGVRWEAMDDSTARATLTDGAIFVSLEFRFDSEGLIDTVRAAARYRTVGGTIQATPWQGRFWNYAVRHGIRIPLEGEVAWQLPAGPLPYWRGRITQIAYEFAR